MSFTNLFLHSLRSSFLPTTSISPPAPSPPPPLPLPPPLAKPSASNHSSSPPPLLPPSSSSGPSTYHNAFDIDPVTGFMPNKQLPTRLPKLFDLWEEALSSAPRLLSLGDDNSPEALAKRESSRLWRLRLANGPIIPVNSISDNVPYLQRAHHVLAFLVHFYMHSIQPPSSSSTSEPLVVPASLAVPLVTVSDRLGIAPILTFADTVLWNWTLKDPSKPLSPENIRPLTLFTQSEDECSFYNCCANIELRGVEALRIILDYDANMSRTTTTTLLGEDNRIQRISEALARLAAVVDELTEILKSVRSTCDPHAFYFRIRPWFRGSDANGPDSPGWVFEGVDSTRQLELSGPSAGQSSTIHALDIFLDVDHQLTKQRLPAPSEQNRRADHSFMTRMRKYMPGKHQEFLLYLASSSSSSASSSHNHDDDDDDDDDGRGPRRRSVRELAREIPELERSYDSVVLALKRFRDQHMRIACLYVVSMSRSASANINTKCPVSAMMKQMQRESEDTNSDANHALRRQPVRGTGGNELSCLLKASRDATARTLLSGNIN